MDYMKQLNRFFELAEADCLPPSAQIVYLHLLNINNRLHWREWFKVANSRLENLTGLGSNKSVISAKNRLKQAGLIEFESDGKTTTRYFIFPLGTQDGTQDGTHLKRHRQKQDKTETKQSTPARVDVFASSGESEKVKALLKDFEEMRNKKRNPMTDRAKHLFLKKLDDLSGGDEFMKIHLLEQSIEHGWQSVYPLKNDLSTSPQRKTRLQENMEAADRAIAFFESQEANRNDEGNGDSQASQTVYDGFPF